jgi:hypothetical protein
MCAKVHEDAPIQHDSAAEKTLHAEGAYRAANS